MSINRISALRVVNYLNFDGPFFDMKEKDTDYAISVSMNRFCIQYLNEIKNNYTIIIYYNNDIYSLLSYIIIKNTCGALKKNNADIRILGDFKSQSEKNFFNGIKTVSLKKARKLKKAILVTGYHPIYNVIDIAELSKFFIEISNPIARFTPQQVETAKSYYINENLEQLLNNTISASQVSQIITCNNLYQYPLSVEKFMKECDLFFSFDYNIPICIFKLNGDESDFPCYDFILKSSKEGNIHTYILPQDEDKKKFIETNLNPYLDLRNQINDLTIIFDVDVILNSVESEEENVQIFSAEDFKEDGE